MDRLVIVLRPILSRPIRPQDGTNRLVVFRESAVLGLRSQIESRQARLREILLQQVRYIRAAFTLCLKIQRLISYQIASHGPFALLNSFRPALVVRCLVPNFPMLWYPYISTHVISAAPFSPSTTIPSHLRSRPRSLRYSCARTCKELTEAVLFGALAGNSISAFRRAAIAWLP